MQGAGGGLLEPAVVGDVDHEVHIGLDEFPEQVGHCVLETNHDRKTRRGQIEPGELMAALETVVADRREPFHEREYFAPRHVFAKRDKVHLVVYHRHRPVGSHDHRAIEDHGR